MWYNNRSITAGGLQSERVSDYERYLYFRYKNTPVSYTHLDVYKRQGFEEPQQHRKNLCDRYCAGADRDRDQIRDPVAGVNREDTVSYTHLDVYKRQVHSI